MIKPNVTTDVYISRDAKSDPNNFVYDFAFKSIVNETISIDAKALGLTEAKKGYSIALYIDAIDEN